MLSKRETELYRRQLTLNGFGVDEQRKLARFHCPRRRHRRPRRGTAAVYLAVAGIGRLVLAHYGTLTLSNMNRQILMKHDWIGNDV